MLITLRILKKVYAVSSCFLHLNSMGFIAISILDRASFPEMPTFSSKREVGFLVTRLPSQSGFKFTFVMPRTSLLHKAPLCHIIMNADQW